MLLSVAAVYDRRPRRLAAFCDHWQWSYERNPTVIDRRYSRLFQRSIWAATFSGDGAPIAVRFAIDALASKIFRTSSSKSGEISCISKREMLFSPRFELDARTTSLPTASCA